MSKADYLRSIFSIVDGLEATLEAVEYQDYASGEIVQNGLAIQLGLLRIRTAERLRVIEDAQLTAWRGVE